LGSTYYVEVWVQDLLAPGVGISGGYVDVGYTTAIVDALSVVHQDFDLLADGVIDDPSGIVDDLGGGTLADGLGVAPQWARLAYVQVQATGLGEATFGLSPGGLQFGRYNAGSVDWSLVDLGTPLAVEQIGRTQIDITIVDTPSAVGGNGEVASLPASRDWVHEWMPFWVEIWVSTPDTTTLGVAQAAVDLQYDTSYLTATDIQYGPAFTLNQTGTIDDGLGVVSEVGGATALTDVGDDAFVLLARVRFASTGSDQVPVDEVGRSIGPYDMQLVLANGQTQLVGAGAAVPELAPTPATELWAVMYDIDDNNLIDFGDLSFFAPAFGQPVGTPASEPPYAWWADFDKSGLVDFGDLSFFAPNFGKTRATGQDTLFPPNFPAGWGETANGSEGEAPVGDAAVGAAAGGVVGAAGLPDSPAPRPQVSTALAAPAAGASLRAFAPAWDSEDASALLAPAGHTGLQSAAELVFPQIDSDPVARGRRTRTPVFTRIARVPDASAHPGLGRWTPLEDDLSLLADRRSDKSQIAAGELVDAVLAVAGEWL